tara:strand:+ start:1326 stop:3080 length:1755 start_codon:yes stop_codon:yes gene_type:complete
MAFSFDSYTGDGTSEFSITFNYLTETVVVGATPKGIEVHLDGIKQTSGYTVNTSTHKVNFSPAPAAGVSIKILRVTPRAAADRLVDFADATIITEAQLDTMALQLLYISQEAFEQSSAGGSVTPTYLAYNETEAYWDATYNAAARELRNIALPRADDAASTKKYVDDVATWGISGVPQSWTFAGTGAQDTFTLAGAPYVEKEMLVVAIDGVLQVPATDFTVAGGPVDSVLDFDVQPGSGTAISVQNFGKMRFLDGVSISDGSITSVKLDQTVGAQAVIRATIRDDAVGAAQLDNGQVDFLHLDATNFTTSTGDSTPRFISVPVNGTGLSLATLSSAHVSDFNTQVQSTRLNEFTAPIASVNMNSQTITNLADPSADQDGATRKYVTDTVEASAGNAGRTKIGTYYLGANSSSFEVSGWFNSALYRHYEFECSQFSHTNSTGEMFMQMADTGGTYRTSSNNVSSSIAGLSSVTGGGTWGMDGLNERMGWVGPSTASASRYTFTIKSWDNHPGWNASKIFTTTGMAYAKNTSTNVFSNSAYDARSVFTYNTGTVTKLRFRAAQQEYSTSYLTIQSGARVTVYGITY